MSAVFQLILIGYLVLMVSGCRTPKPPRIEVNQVVNIAFALQPDGSLQDALERVKKDLPKESGIAQVLAYVNTVKQRAPVVASIGRTRQGELIVLGVPSKELIELTLRDSERVHEVSFLFIFDADDRLMKVTYSTGVFERPAEEAE